MFEGITKFLKKFMKVQDEEVDNSSKDTAKERLHLVLMQDRANVSADFLEMMKQEIIDVIKKYIVVDENAIDVRLTNQPNTDGTTGAPALYANIPIVNIKNEVKGEKMREAEQKAEINEKKDEPKVEENKNEIAQNNNEINKTESNNEKVEQNIKQSNENKTEENNSTKEQKTNENKSEVGE